MGERWARRAVADPDIRAFGVILESYRSLERYFSAELAHKTPLTHTWFETLLRLASQETGELTMSELGKKLDLTSGGVTRLVDRLEQQGYVTRRTSTRDRRVQIAAITPHGADALDEAAATHAANIRARVTDKLTATELATLLEILQRIRIDDEPPDTGS